MCKWVKAPSKCSEKNFTLWRGEVNNSIVALVRIFELISLTQLCHKIPQDGEFLLMLSSFLGTILKEHFVKSGERGLLRALCCPSLASTYLQPFPKQLGGL